MCEVVDVGLGIHVRVSIAVSFGVRIAGVDNDIAAGVDVV